MSLVGLELGLLLNITFCAKEEKLKLQAVAGKKRGQRVAEVFGEAGPGTEKGMLRPRRNEVLRQ